MRCLYSLPSEAKQKFNLFMRDAPVRGDPGRSAAHLCTGALLPRSRGRVIDALDIDEIRWHWRRSGRRRAALMVDYEAVRAHER